MNHVTPILKLLEAKRDRPPIMRNLRKIVVEDTILHLLVDIAAEANVEIEGFGTVENVEMDI